MNESTDSESSQPGVYVQPASTAVVVRNGPQSMSTSHEAPLLPVSRLRPSDAPYSAFSIIDLDREDEIWGLGGEDEETQTPVATSSLSLSNSLFPRWSASISSNWPSPALPTAATPVEDEQQPSAPAPVAPLRKRGRPPKITIKRTSNPLPAPSNAMDLSGGETPVPNPPAIPAPSSPTTSPNSTISTRAKERITIKNSPPPKRSKLIEGSADENFPHRLGPDSKSSRIKELIREELDHLEGEINRTMKRSQDIISSLVDLLD